MEVTQTCACGFVQIPAALTRQAGGSHLSQGGILSSYHATGPLRLLMTPTHGEVPWTQKVPSLQHKPSKTLVWPVCSKIGPFIFFEAVFLL